MSSQKTGRHRLRGKETNYPKLIEPTARPERLYIRRQVNHNHPKREEEAGAIAIALLCPPNPPGGGGEEGRGWGHYEQQQLLI